MRRFIVAALLLAATDAIAQTPVGNGGPFAPPPDAALRPPVDVMADPLPEGVFEKSEENRNGQYPDMADFPMGGLIQDAWNDAPRDAGVKAYRLCDLCVYRMRTREYMLSTVILPDDAEITGIEVGDHTAFTVEAPSPNRLTVRPRGYGADSNMVVFTKSGRVYSFYLRSESFNSEHVPDLLVQINGDDTRRSGPIVPVSAKNDGKKLMLPAMSADQPPDAAAAAVEGLKEPDKVPEGDFARSIEFDPASLHGWTDYELWGDDELRPEAVFRDKHFTYIQFGDRWDGVELPTGYVVIDGIDELVNTRVQGKTFIIESVSPLITLKSGKKFLCLKFTGEAA